jgi:hypothetical protein
MTDRQTLAHKESGPALLGNQRVRGHGFDLCFGAIFSTRGFYLLAWRNQLFRRNRMKKMGGSRLKRKRYAMPDDIREALARNSLLQTYHDRPRYQQNDYIGWITRAKRDDTRRQRITQMLQELARGDRYMKMAYKTKE